MIINEALVVLEKSAFAVLGFMHFINVGFPAVDCVCEVAYGLVSCVGDMFGVLFS